MATTSSSESDPKKQLISLIRNLSTEKSLGERRIVELKKRIDELRSESESANADLEKAKRIKETSDRDLKVFEVESSIVITQFHALQARVSLIQEEISVSGSNLEALKSEEGALRDEFINKMCKLNADMRKFQEETAQAFSPTDCTGMSTKDAGQELARAEIISIERKLAELITETSSTEKECQEAQIAHKQEQADFGV